METWQLVGFGCKFFIDTSIHRPRKLSLEVLIHDVSDLADRSADVQFPLYGARTLRPHYAMFTHSGFCQSASTEIPGPKHRAKTIIYYY